MKSEEVIQFHSEAKSLGLRFWIDGGWAVDALLEKQTREHSDLDIAVEKTVAPGLVSLLTKNGFRETNRESEWNYVMVDGLGHRIDFHVFTFNEENEVVSGLLYPTDSLTGKGKIGGVEVDCISPKRLVEFHTGYELDETDYTDVSALCRKFNLEYPKEFNRFRGIQ